MAEGNQVRTATTGSASPGPSPFVVQFSNEVSEPAWDAFVAAVDGGNHMQSSLWAQVKSTLGWSVCRVLARRGREIVGGAQILIRRLPLAGALGYVPRGPVLAQDDPLLMGVLLDTLRTIAHEQRLQYLLIQPSHGNPAAPRCSKRPAFARASCKPRPRRR